MTKTAKNGERSGSIGFGDAAALAYASIATSTTRESTHIFVDALRMRQFFTGTMKTMRGFVFAGGGGGKRPRPSEG